MAAKKSEQEHIKRITRKFLEVPRGSRAKQRQRNVQKKVCCMCKVVILLIRSTDCFWLFSLSSTLSIIRLIFYILF